MAAELPNDLLAPPVDATKPADPVGEEAEPVPVGNAPPLGEVPLVIG